MSNSDHNNTNNMVFPKQHKCLACGTTEGTPSDKNDKAEVWEWIINPPPLAGPFCSERCAKEWNSKAREEERMTAIWGNTKLPHGGNYLKALIETNRIKNNIEAGEWFPSDEAKNIAVPKAETQTPNSEETKIASVQVAWKHIAPQAASQE